MAAKLDQQIEALEQRLKQAKARKRMVEARKRAAESAKKRADDTRRKILVGAAILAKVERGDWPEDKMLAMMNETLTRPDDRALFGLDPLKTE
jgi:mobilization protein C